MQPAALLALSRDARPEDLRQPVVVGGDDPELVLDLLPHPLRPRLRSEKPVLEGKRGDRDPHLLNRLGDEHRVGGSSHERRRLEVHHDLDLAGGVAARGRDDRRTDPLRPVVEAEPPGEQAVPEGDLDDVVLRHAPGGEDAGHEVAPRLDVVERVPHHGRRPRRSRGGVDADDLPHRHREQPVRVVLPKVLLRRERQPREVVERPEVLRRDPQLVELPPVEGDVPVHPVQRRLEPLQLKLCELFPVHPFLHGLPVHRSLRSRHILPSASRSLPR